MRSVKFYHRKMWADITGPGFIEFDDDGTRHREDVRTTDFARENFSALPYPKKCFYRFMMWHYSTRVIVFYNFLADVINLAAFGYYVIVDSSTYQFNTGDALTINLMTFIMISKLRPTLSSWIHATKMYLKREFVSKFTWFQEQAPLFTY